MSMRGRGRRNEGSKRGVIWERGVEIVNVVGGWIFFFFQAEDGIRDVRT